MSTSRTSVDEIKHRARDEYRNGIAIGLSHDEAIQRSVALTGNAKVAVEEWCEGIEAAGPMNAEREMATADGLGGDRTVLYAVGFQTREGWPTRRVFGSAIEAASCYLEWAGIDGSVSSYGDDLAAGVIFEAERGDNLITAGDATHSVYPCDDGYDDALPHLRGSEGS